MCINKKRFYNKWLHSWQWVDCGSCPACRQAKAERRTRRIRSAVYAGYVTLFVTLTYRNINIPYIRKDELQENSSYINIYRDCSVRRVRIKADYSMAYKYVRQTKLIHRVDCFEKRMFFDSKDVSGLSKLRGQSDGNKVGVLFFKDVQDFEKRLRINAQRRYGIIKPIYSFKCSEIGPSTKRPHFHLLISVPQENLAELQSAIIEAWPFDSRIKSAKSIQIARNAASYVSSYVNRGSDFPKFFNYAAFRPKHSFSKGYGTTCCAYSLENILKKFHDGDLRFDPNFYGIKSAKNNVLFPSYACNKYFAKCYGYSRFTYDEISWLCKSPDEFFMNSDVLPRLFLSDKINEFTGLYDYAWDKVRSVVSLIKRLRKRFCDEFVYYEDGKRYVGLPYNDYSYELFADYYYRFWRLYQSNLIRLQYEEVNLSEYAFIFENWDEVWSKRIRSDLTIFADFTNRSILEDPSLFKRNVIQSFRMTKSYHDHYKRRKVTNYCMAYSGFNV